MENEVQQSPTMKLPEKMVWFGKVDGKSDLLQIIKSVSNGLYVVAIIQLIAGLFLSVSLIVDSVIYAIFSFLLQKFNSRIVAVLLLLVYASSLPIRNTWLFLHQ